VDNPLQAQRSTGFVIENEMPTVVAGKRKVTEELHKDKAAIRQTQQATMNDNEQYSLFIVSKSS
jgi:hypothetical protein